jgi:hypothetical protein
MQQDPTQGYKVDVPVVQDIAMMPVLTPAQNFPVPITLVEIVQGNLVGVHVQQDIPMIM